IGVSQVSNKGMSLKEPQVECLKATFAMGCFWGSDVRFPSYNGVIRTRVGYCGGTKPNPTYYNLGDHTEAIDIDYDPKTITFQHLLEVFWEHHDPTVQHKRQYMSAIFYHDDEQKRLAEDSMKEEQKKYSRPIVTQILKSGPFYEAEDYHQKYHLRQYPAIFKSLNLEGKALINSHVAAKLNAFLGGVVSVQQFEEQHKELGLSEEQISAIRKLIEGGLPHHC
ncbi:peptide methionine sulfoxide reductase-like protein, partial [Dinothrombium tinctorium]